MIEKKDIYLLILWLLLCISGGIAIIYTGNYPIDPFVFKYFRLPRLINAVSCGIALPLSGMLLQIYFRNPLAGPYVLGLGSGAGFGVAVAMLINFTYALSLPVWSVPFAAITGSMAVLLILLFLHRFIHQNTTLLLAGIFLGSVISGITALIEIFALPEQLKSFIIWNMGSFDNTSPETSMYILPCIVSIAIIVLLQSKSINAYSAGEVFAFFSGVHVKRLGYFFILVSSILTGLSMAYFGPVAFVGMAMPHLARMIHKTAHHLILIPASAFMGIFTLLLTDFLSHHLINGIVIPLNIFLSIIAGPFILWLVISKKNYL
ncbi:MAG: iron ABC transporter [Vicingaceae bacterium]|nr:MAG: iron ABC transporter [Vicingaceae bacterium]